MPAGITLSIQCDDSGVEKWASMLLRIQSAIGSKAFVSESKIGTQPSVEAPIPEGVFAYAQSWSGGEDWLEVDIVERFKRLRRANGGNDELAYQELLKMDGEDKSNGERNSEG